MIEFLTSIITAPLAWLGALLGCGAAYLAWKYLPVSLDRASIGAILIVGGIAMGCAIQYLLERDHQK